MSPSGTPVCNLGASALSSSLEPDFSTENVFNLCETPQPMKQESRRPSLAYSSFSDESLSVSTPASILSQPVTPIARTRGHNDLINDLTGNVTTKLNMAVSCESLAQQHLSESFLDINSPCMGGAFPMMHGLPVPSDLMKGYASYVPRGFDSPIRYGVYAQSPSTSLDMHPGLKSTLFPPMYGIGMPTPMTTTLDVASSIGMTAGPGVVSSDTFSMTDSRLATRQPYHQQDQVIVPSQLGAESAFTAGAYTSPLIEHEDCKQEPKSLDSFMLEDGDYVHVDRDIPYENCCMGMGDVSDYMLVDYKTPATPCARPSRPRRRGVRRSRKASAVGMSSSPPSSTICNPNRQPWRTHYDAALDCHVQFEGTPFTVELDDNGKVKNLSTLAAGGPDGLPSPGDGANAHLLAAAAAAARLANSKPNACDKCNMRFRRIEHLKRHVQSHVTDHSERPYFCPLPSCNGRRIGRSDNARDHIKTHLRPHAPGKRNEHCSWAEMERRIREQYSREKAERLLKNLEEWIVGEYAKREEAEREKGVGKKGVVVLGRL